MQEQETKKNTIDKDEIDKFNKISNLWWEKNSPFEALFKINPLRISYIDKLISNQFNLKKNNIKILDIGCGGGIGSFALAKLGYDVCAIDASYENIKNCSKKYPSLDNLQFIHQAVENHEKNNHYDVIIALEIIEHVDYKSFLHETIKKLSPNGMIVISTINRTIKSLLFAKIFAEYVLNMVPKQTHDPRKFLKPEEISTIMLRNNFNILEKKGLKYMPHKDDFELSDDTDINYFISFKRS